MATSTLVKPRRGHAYAAKPNAQRILDVWHLATPDEIDAGMTWYDAAHDLAVELTPENPREAAGVIAALSPRTPWVRNQDLAYRAYRDGAASGTLGANTRKADAIMAGADFADVLKGDKVRNFAEIIADPSNPDAVCVDRHAFDVAQGRVTNDETRGALTRVGMYDRFAEAYRRAARTLSADLGVQVTPAQVQAVTWVVWRRLKGISD